MAIFIGRVVGSAPPNRLVPGDANRALWAQDSGAPVLHHGRVVAIGSWTGRDAGSGAITKRWALYVGQTLLGATQFVTTGAQYNGPSGGANVQGLIDPATIYPGRRSRSNHLIVVPTDRLTYADIDYSAGSRASATGLIGNAPRVHRQYYRTVSNGAAPNPLQPNQSVNQGQYLAIYAVLEPNRAPSATVDVALTPVGTTPDSPAIVGRTDPTITVRFTDADRTAGYLDFPTSVTLSAYRWTGSGWQGVGQALYRVGVDYPQPADNTAPVDLTLRLPTGLLQMGDTYRIHAQAVDEFGAASLGYANAAGYWLSQVELSVLPGGYIEDAAPDGRITDLSPDITGTYQNEGGENSVSIAVRLQRQGTNGIWSVVATSPAIAEVVTPGSPFTITWAETGFADLETTSDYALEFQAIDAAGTIGPWYGRTVFHTNYRPRTPTAITPSNAQRLTSAPLVTFDMTDPDDVPVLAGGALEGELEISGPFTINGTFDVDAAGWSDGGNAPGLTATKARATDQVRSGAGSYKIDITANSGAAGAAVAYTAMQPVVPDYSYTVQGWRRASSTGVTGYLALFWYNASSVFISATLTPPGTVAAGTWQLLQLTAAAPANAAFARVRLQANVGAGITGTAWFDDVAWSSGARALLDATKVAGANNRWQVQTVLNPTLANAGQYSLRARGYDGNLYGEWSSPASIIMDVGPAVTILAPTPAVELATHRPTITWEVVGDQDRYRVLLWEEDGTTLKHDSGWVTSALVRDYIPPAGPLGADDEAIVEVQVDDNGLIGYASPVPFQVLYPLPAAPTDLSATYAMLDGDDDATVVELNWTPVDTAPDQLVRMEVHRTDTTDGTTEQLAEFVGFDPGTYTDHRPLSGVAYRYLVRQVAIQGTEERSGEQAAVDAQLDLQSAVLHEVNAPDLERLVLKWWDARDSTFTNQQSFAVPAGGTDYVESRGLLAGQDLEVDWAVADADAYGGSSGMTAIGWRNRAKRMFERGELLYYRDPTGEGMLCVLNGQPQISQSNRRVAKFNIRLGLRRVADEVAG